MERAGDVPLPPPVMATTRPLALKMAAGSTAWAGSMAGCLWNQMVPL